MAKTICEVSKFGSHQVMVKIGKRGRYKTPEYKEYEWEMRNGIMELPRVVEEVPVIVHLTFNTKGGVEPEMWKVINRKTNRTWRNCESLEVAKSFDSEKYRIEYHAPKILYGVNGDWDNLAKPVLDYMESMRRIPNDRFVSIGNVEYTYNNSKNTIEIEVVKAEVYVSADNIYRFRRP